MSNSKDKVQSLKLPKQKKVKLTDEQVEKMKSIDFEIQNIYMSVGKNVLESKQFVNQMGHALAQKQSDLKKEIKFICKKNKINPDTAQAVDYKNKALIVS